MTCERSRSKEGPQPADSQCGAASLPLQPSPPHCLFSLSSKGRVARAETCSRGGETDFIRLCGEHCDSQVPHLSWTTSRTTHLNLICASRETEAKGHKGTSQVTQRAPSRAHNQRLSSLTIQTLFLADRVAGLQFKLRAATPLSTALQLITCNLTASSHLSSLPPSGEIESYGLLLKRTYPRADAVLKANGKTWNVSGKHLEKKATDLSRRHFQETVHLPCPSFPGDSGQSMWHLGSKLPLL